MWSLAVSQAVPRAVPLALKVLLALMVLHVPLCPTLDGVLLAYVQETNWDAQKEKACVNTYAHASASQICLQNICGQQQNFPMAGPTFGSKSETGPKQRPKRRNENVIQFWTPFWGHIWTQKWGQPSENFVAARKCFASRFATRQLEHECQHIPFSLCASQGRLLLSRSLYRSHVLNTFFGPVLGAMMKQVCWDSRLTEACPRPGLGRKT